MFAGEQFGKAAEAINLYISLFPQSFIKTMEYFQAGELGGEEGTVKNAVFTLSGTEYMAFDSAMGHQFTFTPSMSIFVNCESEEELDKLFNELSKEGAVMMPPDNYGFSEKFAWIADRYGVSWQFNLK